MSAAAPSPQRPRFIWLDICRGLAVCAMIVYHLGFDLSLFAVIQANFYHDPVLKAIRTAIVTSFLFIVGVSLVVAQQANQSPRAFWWRIAKITACALLVTAVTIWRFQTSYIYFGILHFIALASILAQPMLRLPKIALVIIGFAFIAVGMLFAHPIFNPKPLSWIGFVTELPRTEDFVPIFPWFGVVLLGAAYQLSKVGFRKTRPAKRQNIFMRALSWMGRRSLWIYMLHQPIIIAILWIVFV